MRTQLVRRLATVQAAIDAHAAGETAEDDLPPVRAKAPARAAKESATSEPKRAPRPRGTTRPAPAGT